jgi:uncharacterized protein DUF5063
VPEDKDLKISRFMETAQSYCVLVESCRGIPKRVFVEQCLGRLSDLFTQALELPLPRIRGKKPGLPDVTHEEWNVIFKRLQAKLGKHDRYWMVFEPFETPQPEAIHGSLADDLADTWRDLKGGLLAARAGKRARAVWDWRFLFEHHWGPHHAAHAFRPLHGLLFGPAGIPVRFPRRRKKRPKAK